MIEDFNLASSEEETANEGENLAATVWSEFDSDDRPQPSPGRVHSNLESLGFQSNQTLKELLEASKSPAVRAAEAMLDGARSAISNPGGTGLRSAEELLRELGIGPNVASPPTNPGESMMKGAHEALANRPSSHAARSILGAAAALGIGAPPRMEAPPSSTARTAEDVANGTVSGVDDEASRTRRAVESVGNAIGSGISDAVGGRRGFAPHNQLDHEKHRERPTVIQSLWNRLRDIVDPNLPNPGLLEPRMQPLHHDTREQRRHEA